MIIIREKVVYDGDHIQVVKITCKNKINRWVKWEMVKRKTLSNEIVAIFALTEKNEVILERNYRIPCRGHVIELPAGLLDVQRESPRLAVARELREETGYRVGQSLRLVMQGPFNAGMTNDELSIYFTKGARKVGSPKLEDAEDIEVILVPLKKLVNFILNPPGGCKVDIKILNVLPVLQKKGLI